MDKVKLGEIAVLINGDRGKNYPSQADIMDDGEIPFVNAGHLNGKNIDFSDMNYISREKYEKLSSGKFEKGDILYCLRGSLGKKAIVNDEVRGAIASSLVIIRPDRKKVNGDYLMYSLNAPTIREQLTKANNGSSQPNLSASSVREFWIELPTLSVQKDVVKKLTKLQHVIEKRQNQIGLLDNLVKARFVEMFGNPFDVKTKVKWPIKTICDLSESIMDGSNVDKALYKQNGDVLFLRIQNVWCNEFKLEDSVYISEIENEEYKDTSLKHGDLLITKIGRYYTSDSSLGRVSVYLGDDDKANYSNNIMRIRFKDGINSEFINTLMNLDDYNKFIRRTSVGGTDKRALSKGLISSYPIIVPPSDKQNEFVGFLHQVDKSKFSVMKGNASFM